MEGIVIRPVAQSDAEPLIAANRASTALHHPWSWPFTDMPGFRAYLATLDGDRNRGFVALHGPTGSLVGVITLSQIARGNFQSAYLGFYGLAGQVGCGRMSAAVRAALAHAFGPLGLHRVEANVQPANKRSIALLGRVGFRHEGFSPRYLMIDGAWRDHERWAILADEFTA